MKDFNFLKFMVTGLAALMTGPAFAEDVLRISIPADIRSTNPGVSRDGTTDIVMAHVVEPLVAPRDNLEIGPALAKSWTVSPDGRTYIFTLRDGATFHNGEPVTSKEVVWSWERMLKPETKFLCRNWFDGTGPTGIKIEKIEAVDTRTVAFKLAQPQPMFLARMGHIPCVSAILHPSSVGPDGNWKEPVGTGPFRITEWKKDQYLELRRYEGYKPLPGQADGLAGGREPLVDKLRFTIIPDPAAAKMALLAGDLDVATALDLDAIPELKASSSVKVESSATAGMEVLLLRNTDPLLKSREMRQAIAYALDRTPIAELATGGLGEPNPSFVAPQTAFWGEEFKKAPPQNFDKVRELLAAAGYKGEPVTIVTNMQQQADNKSAIMIQAMLQQAGINAQLEIMEFATQIQAQSKGTYQAMVMAFSARPDVTMALDVFVGDSKQRTNAVTDDPAIQAMVSESGQIADPQKRRALLTKIHAALLEDATTIVLFNRVEADGLAANVEGYKRWAMALPRFWGVRLKK